ncbi:MAG: choice-of-anchor J domain-containing protein, partial [Muribaculaceae bacterium]
DITVTAKASTNAPAPVVNLSIEPAPLGMLSATISFTAPTLTSTGAELASLSYIEIYRDGELIHTIDSPAPGAALNYTDDSAAQGFNTYTVICDADGSKSVESAATAYIGLDVPVAVVNPRATCLNDGKITLSWSTPDASVNGGYFDSATLKYVITNLDDGTQTTVEGNSHELVFALGEQALYQFSIEAQSQAGSSDSSKFNTVIMGNPITDEYAESFANGSVHSLWYQDSDEADFEWISDDPENEEYSDPDVKGYTIYAQDGDHGDLIAMSEYAFENETSRYCSPLFNLSNFENPVFTFYMINGPKDVLRLQVRTAGGEWVDVAEPVWETGINGLQWSRCTTPLANLKQAGTIQFSFVASGGSRPLHIDNISIAEAGFAHDIAVTDFTASPLRANIGEITTFTVELRNFGGSAESEYSVVLYRDGIEVQRNAGADIQATECFSTNFTYTATLDDALAEQKCIWTAEVVLDTDTRADNNHSKPLTWSVRLSEVPDASGLSATAETDGIRLQWDAAETREAAEKGDLTFVTDDFESYTPFAIDNIGGWTLVDKDGCDTWNTNYPTRPYVGEPLSFMVFNTVDGGVQTDENEDNIFFAHSGVQYMMGFSNAEYGSPNNDWLISPRLDGRAHTIDFYARIPMSLSGDDVIDVAYSTTDTDPDSFTPLPGGEDIHIQDNWRHVSLDVPDGTRYCAVNLKLSQMFFELDDFTYAQHDGSADALTLIGYNVYRNGVRINTEPVTETEYFDTNIDKGTTYNYKVTALYRQGESRYSNEVLVTTSAIENIATETSPVEYFNLQGIRVAEPTAPGIYIRRQGSTATKIIR